MTGALGMILALAAGAAAGTYGPAGERGAFLARMAGARSAAMGEAFTGVADDASAAGGNPGGLGQVRAFSAVAQQEGFAGLDGLDGVGTGFGAFALPLPGGVVGIALATMRYGEYDERDAYGAATGRASADDLAVMASWATLNPAWFGRAGWSGLRAEVVREGAGRYLPGVSAGGIIPVRGEARIGWALEHLSAGADGFVLPAAFKLGASFRETRAPVPARIAAELSHAFVPGRSRAAVGVEVFPVAALAVRAGYRWQSKDDGLEGLVGLTAGLGVRLGGLGLDWAWQPRGDLATSHRASVSYELERAVPARWKPSTMRETMSDAEPRDGREPGLRGSGDTGSTVPAEPGSGPAGDEPPPDAGAIGVPHVPGAR